MFLKSATQVRNWEPKHLPPSSVNNVATRVACFEPHVTLLCVLWNVQNTLPPCVVHSGWNAPHALIQPESCQLGLYWRLSAHSGTNVGSLEKKKKNSHIYARTILCDTMPLASVVRAGSKFRQCSKIPLLVKNEVNVASTTMRNIIVEFCTIGGWSHGFTDSVWRLLLQRSFSPKAPRYRRQSFVRLGTKMAGFLCVITGHSNVGL